MLRTLSDHEGQGPGTKGRGPYKSNNRFFQQC